MSLVELGDRPSSNISLDRPSLYPRLTENMKKDGRGDANMILELYWNFGSFLGIYGNKTNIQYLTARTLG